MGARTMRHMRTMSWFLAGTVLVAGCVTDPKGALGPPGSATITVIGRVLTVLNQPAAGVSVALTGQPATLTDASGNFTVTDVIAPYDAVVVDGSGQTASLYKGLSRTDPTLVAWASFNGLPAVGSAQWDDHRGSLHPQSTLRLSDQGVFRLAGSLQRSVPGWGSPRGL